ncbi:MAG TPA: FliM/FliN family flagellar motor C-terminal domain-containing protein [Pirellulaceae bacterium]|nr:FliM/FliN family flagellar motor C-terminal domain-containing protein [Pirellulaceae bacterium]
MALTTTTVASVLAACQTGAAEAADALSRSLDGKFTLTPGEEIQLSPAALASDFSGPGLLVVLKVGGDCAVFAVPEATGLLPAWYAAPDATGTSKLTTLAQELGMLLLPEDEMPDDFAAFRVQNIVAALERGQLATSAQAVTLQLASGAQQGTALLIWPLSKPAALNEPVVSAPPVAAPKPAPVVKPAAPPAPAAPRYDGIEDALPSMPSYTRSLLKIRVPIVVTLARTKQPLSRIVELAPGSIIPFTKSCEDALILEVNNREVAAGEAVKVGEKFGLRITSMTMPPERFVALQGKRGR